MTEMWLRMDPFSESKISRYTKTYKANLSIASKINDISTHVFRRSNLPVVQSSLEIAANESIGLSEPKV